MGLKEVIGDATLYCCDSLEILPCLVDAIITSPPYDNLREYGGHVFEWGSFIQPLSDSLLPGAVMVWNVCDAVNEGSETGTSFRQALAFKEAGLRLHDTMIYLKSNVNFPDAVRYEHGFEYMFVLSNGAPKTFNPIQDRPNKWAGTVMHGTDRQPDGSTKPISGLGKVISRFGKRFNWWWMVNNQPDTGHPAPMPYAMAYDHIASWTNQGNTVLDPFMGSGTTAIASLKQGRKFIGCDVEAKYFDIACRRVEEFYRQPDLLAIQFRDQSVIDCGPGSL